MTVQVRRWMAIELKIAKSISNRACFRQPVEFLFRLSHLSLSTMRIIVGPRNHLYSCREYLIKIAFALLAALNLLSFITYWVDKLRAGRGQDRISEFRLLQLSFLGPFGSIPGIWWVRHKTKKTSYLLKYFPVLIMSFAAHAVIVYFWMTQA